MAARETESRVVVDCIMRTGGEALSSSNFDCCPRAARRGCGGDRNACDIVVFIRSSAATLFLVFDAADVPADVDADAASGVGTAETFSVLVVVSVDGGGSAALSLCMRPICMRTPRLFLNLLRILCMCIIQRYAT